MAKKKAAKSKPRDETLDPDIRRLARTIEQDCRVSESVRATAPLLIKELARCARLQEQLDVAFGGLPLDVHDSPTSPKNVRRFYTYLAMAKALTKFKIRLIHEWMRIHGVDPANPLQMLEVPGGIPVIPSKDQSDELVVSPEDLLLAEKLRPSLKRPPACNQETNAGALGKNRSSGNVH